MEKRGGRSLFCPPLPPLSARLKSDTNLFFSVEILLYFIIFISLTRSPLLLTTMRAKVLLKAHQGAVHVRTRARMSGASSLGALLFACFCLCWRAGGKRDSSSSSTAAPPPPESRPREQRTLRRRRCRRERGREREGVQSTRLFLLSSSFCSRPQRE
jgi:hypothetical protein